MNRLRRTFLVAALAIVVAAGVIVAAAAWWFRDAVYVDRSLPAAPVSVVVPRGTSFGGVVTALRDRRVLAQPLAFRLLARFRHDDGDIKAGEYHFPAHQTADDILRRLVAGEADAVWLTIPEGFTAREISARLADRKLATGFARYALSTGIMFDGARTPTLEGYLFPSTYLIPVDADDARIAKIFTDQFRRVLPPDAEAQARKFRLTIPQVVTLASLIEREAKADDERALMAGVYYNRLRVGMPLEVDATIEYTFPTHHDVITRRDLQSESPYNTYLHTGLPPTPIANPGKASIDAAFHPTPSRYLYYVYKGDGHHAFAQTLEEHNANVARYLR